MSNIVKALVITQWIIPAIAFMLGGSYLLWYKLKEKREG